MKIELRAVMTGIELAKFNGGPILTTADFQTVVEAGSGFHVPGTVKMWLDESFYPTLIEMLRSHRTLTVTVEEEPSWKDLEGKQQDLVERSERCSDGLERKSLETRGDQG